MRDQGQEMKSQGMKNYPVIALPLKNKMATSQKSEAQPGTRASLGNSRKVSGFRQIPSGVSHSMTRPSAPPPLPPLSILLGRVTEEYSCMLRAPLTFALPSRSRSPHVRATRVHFLLLPPTPTPSPQEPFWIRAFGECLQTHFGKI